MATDYKILKDRRKEMAGEMDPVRTQTFSFEPFTPSSENFSKFFEECSRFIITNLISSKAEIVCLKSETLRFTGVIGKTFRFFISVTSSLALRKSKKLHLILVLNFYFSNMYSDSSSVICTKNF